MNRFQGCRVLGLDSVRKKPGTVWGEAVLFSLAWWPWPCLEGALLDLTGFSSFERFSPLAGVQSCKPSNPSIVPPIASYPSLQSLLSSVHPFLCLSIYLTISPSHCSPPTICSFLFPFVCSLTHSSIHLPPPPNVFASTNPPIHPSIHPPTHPSIQCVMSVYTVQISGLHSACILARDSGKGITDDNTRSFSVDCPSLNQVRVCCCLYWCSMSFPMTFLLFFHSFLKTDERISP